MPDQKPTLEYGKRPLRRAPFWVLLVMMLVSGVVGIITAGVGFFALFHHSPLTKYDDTVKNALILAGLELFGSISTFVAFALTWGRRYR